MVAPTIESRIECLLDQLMSPFTDTEEISVIEAKLAILESRRDGQP